MLFRRMASEYDTTIRVFQPSYDDMLRLSTDFARVLAPGRLRCLDYGTGTGAALPGLLNHFDEVVAVDPQPAMLEVARTRVSGQLAASAARVSFVGGDSLSPEIARLPDASFDAAHCSLVLMFVKGGEAKRETLSVLRRLLRPQGVLVLTELLVQPDDEPRFALWRSLMRQRGADDAQVARGEQQVHSLMHRTSAEETQALLQAAGFTGSLQAYQALHTAIFVARR